MAFVQIFFLACGALVVVILHIRQGFDALHVVQIEGAACHYAQVEITYVARM